MASPELRDLEAALELLSRTLKEVQEEREQLRGERNVLRSERNEFIRTIEREMTERRQLQTLLTACQKALHEMQAQRDRAREGKR